MHSCDLLGLLDEVSTPIQLAQKAVKDDDPIALKKLLVNPNHDSVDQSKLVGEETWVNAQAMENLLHYAVHECAAKCVALLTRPPYQWSPDRRNLVGRTAAQIAEKRGYLPIWFPLVTQSSQAGAQWSSGDSATVRPSLAGDTRSVSYLLLYPHEILNKPLNIDQELVFSQSRQMPGQSFAVVDKSGTVNWQLSAANVVLFFELYIATPDVVQQQSTGHCQFWPWTRTHEHDIAYCVNYPECLRSPLSLNETNAFLHLFSFWKSHRLSIIADMSDSGQISDSQVVLPPVWAPMRLDEQCRLLIRRLLVSNLCSRSKEAASRSDALNYAHHVNQLPLPVRVKAFLAYRELWPVLARHRVPTTATVLPNQPVGFAYDDWHVEFVRQDVVYLA